MKAAPIMMGVLGLVVGLVVGRFLAKETPSAESPHETRHAGSNGTRATPPPSRTVEEKHNFHSLIESLRESGGTAPEMQAKLETMSVAALMKVLADVCSRQGADSNEFLANSSTCSAVARELFRRKGMGAIAEAEKEPDRNLRFMMTGAFMDIALKESPFAAKEWMERRGKEYGIEPSGFMDQFMIKGATLAGAAELIALRERYGDKWTKQGQAFPGTEIPPDFDFALLVKHFPTDDNFGMKRAMTTWGVTDKEAAMKAMRENISQHGGKAAANFGAVVTGVAITEGNEKAAEWMVKQLDSLQGDARMEALGSFNRTVLDLQTQNMNEATVVAIASKLPQAEDRIGFVGSTLTDLAEPEENLRILEALPSAAEQEQALIKGLSRLHGYGDENLRERVRDFSVQLNFSEDARLRVMNELVKPVKRPGGF